MYEKESTEEKNQENLNRCCCC